jgi:hypothetical protein
MMKFPQANWIETSIVDNVTDKITGLPEIRPGSRTRSLVSCVQCLHVNTIGLSRGWIHSKRRNKLHQTKFKCVFFLLIPTSSVEGRDTCMDKRRI